jgi:uncharacterized membrane protein
VRPATWHHRGPGRQTRGKRDAIAGGIVGLIFPPSIVAGAVDGGAGGGIWGKLRDKGFKDEDLKAIGESLPPGSAAIIAIAEDHVIERQRGLEGYDRIAQHALSANAAAQSSPKPTRHRTKAPRRPEPTAAAGIKR